MGCSEGKNRLGIQKKFKFSLMQRGIKKITITNSKNFNMEEWIKCKNKLFFNFMSEQFGRSNQLVVIEANQINLVSFSLRKLELTANIWLSLPD